MDNASERSYQRPFSQMLVGLGHKVAHSTRHSAIELGKDVISVAPDGQPYAFQLKGNPGSRLTLAQFREIEAQLFELAAQPLTYPGLKKGSHRSFLVTNGQVDEEVQLAIRNLNERLANMGMQSNAIEIWSRGELLQLANSLGASLWPSEVPDLTALLEILALKGTEEFPREKMHAILLKLLCLEDGPKAKLGVEEFKRRISSAALLIGICLGRFHNKSNHRAVIDGSLMSISYAVACAERYGFSVQRNVSQSIAIATEAIRDALREMCAELVKDPKLGGGGGLDFKEIYEGRRLLISAYMAIHWMWSEEAGWEVPAQREFLDKWLPELKVHPIWGEGAVPQLLAVYWRQSAVSAKGSDQLDLAAITSTIVQRLRNPDLGLAGPYYSFSDVITHTFRDVLGASEDVLRREAMSGASYTAEGLLHLLVRANLKLRCKMIWPSFNHLAQSKFTPKEPWQFCLLHNEDGHNPSVLLEHNQTWDSLVELARDCRVPGAPKALLDNKYIACLFAIMFPHRLTTEFTKYLDHRLGSVWFIPPAITN